MNKNLKIVLILLSTIALSILGVRQCINEYGDLTGLMYKATGMSDDSDRSSQEGLIYQLDDEGDYIRLKGKKVFRDPQDIANDYYVYITNSYFSNLPPMDRTREEGDPNFSMGTEHFSLVNNKEIVPQFLVLDHRKYEDGQGVVLLIGVSQEIDKTGKDIDFSLMTEILEKQIDGVYKKMYPEDIVLLDKIKSEIPNLITTYTNMDNHLEKDHDIDYSIRYGQQYGLRIYYFISANPTKYYYVFRVSRLHINL